MSLPAPDYLAVGHLSRDHLPDGGFRWGGTVLYAAATAAAMGERAAILTRAGDEAPLPALPGVEWRVLPSARTTTFRNEYDTAGGRKQVLKARAEPLGLAHLPAAWRRAAILHVAPVMGECDRSLLEAEAAFRGLTPQGFLRRVDAEGRVHPAPWPEAEALLPRCDAVVLSVEDVGGAVAQVERWARRVPLLVLTNGAKGGWFFVEGQRHPYAAFPARLVDPTGAGDIFAAALFVALRRGWGVGAAVRLAACLSAASVERPGLEGVPDAAALHACGWSG